tara:strand:+ start:1552 stop:3105 length:1554 start_codon:yes stop_codon:yes gene_type:complete
MPTFRLYEDSLQDRFLKSKAKIQFYGGGFANGKTATACIKTLRIAKDYPGANILIARSTYPKLNDTIRKEFLKWCPSEWIKSFPKSANASNTCTLTNGTTVNFRYIQQQGKSGQESTTSNLLSATYDAIVVDQIEDPEIVHKDMLDLLGRLRGMTPYEGTDPDMPRTGPRMLIITSNPTRNWVYREIVKPMHDLQRGAYNEKLMCETDENGKIIRGEDGLPIPIVEIFEGSTYENKENLEKDFIKTLESTYRGQMKDRFLLGKWASYEGLVYPHFDEDIHVMQHHHVVDYYNRLVMQGAIMSYLEGYDYGLAVPYCYMVGFVDNFGNVFLMDGGYEKEVPLQAHFDKIAEIRSHYRIDRSNHILADPDIFRRKSAGSKSLVGRSINDMFTEEGIYCERGNNNKANGIVKITQYLIPQEHHQHPILGTFGSPYLFVSDKLEFCINEFNDYYWKKDTTGAQVDEPVDKDDHAMDTVKYMMSHRPNISKVILPPQKKDVGWMKWGERDLPDNIRSVRHGR